MQNHDQDRHPNQDGAVELVSMFWKMPLTGKISTVAFCLYGIPLIASFIWSAFVSQPDFNPDQMRLRDGGSVGWTFGSVVSKVLRGVDAEIRPLLEPEVIDRRPLVEQQADNAEDIIGDGL